MIGFRDEVNHMEEINIILGISNVIVGLIMIALFIPLKKGLVKMNIAYGVRIKKSFESEENWYTINKYGAKRFMFWSIPLILVGLFTFFIPLNENEILILLFACAPLIVLIPTIETLLYAKKL
jgi:hypothetical protein